MVHHGKTLKRQIARLGLTQQAAAKKMGFVTRQPLTVLYLREEFNEVQLQKAINGFGIEREIFFQPSAAPPVALAAPAAADGPYWQQLLAAQDIIIAAQAKIIELQQQVMEMKSAQRPAPSAQRPAPSAQRPAPSAQRPAPSAQRPAPSAHSKQQAASSKQQAASSKQQAASSKQQAASKNKLRGEDTPNGVII